MFLLILEFMPVNRKDFRGLLQLMKPFGSQFYRYYVQSSHQFDQHEFEYIFFGLLDKMQGNKEVTQDKIEYV